MPLKTCPNGHQYHKTSDCPVCPICEREKQLEQEFLAVVSAPARRVLEREGIDTLQKLSKWTEMKLLKLHGIGPSAIPKLKECLEKEDLRLVD